MASVSICNLLLASCPLDACSSTGIGYALARKFLKAGDNVVICSRSAERVESVANDLKKEFGEQHVGLSVMLEKERM